MNRLLKIFLLWLLIAALPLQGMAAVVKASCGQRHHTAVMAADATRYERHHAHEDGDAHHGGHGHGTVATADHELQNADEDSPSDSTNLAHAACSACAACCVGAVAPPSSLSLASVLGKVSTAITPPALSFTGFIPPGLERPPKSLSV